MPFSDDLGLKKTEQDIVSNQINFCPVFIPTTSRTFRRIYRIVVVDIEIVKGVSQNSV